MPPRHARHVVQAALVRTAVVLATLYILPTPVSAQTAGQRAISGVISDTQGGRLAGVTVILTSDGLDVPQVTTSTPDGTYLFAALPSRSYRVTFELENFRTVEHEVTLTDEGTVTLDITLELAVLTQVDVVAVAPLLGSSVDARRVPANVRTISGDDLEQSGARALGDLLDRRLGGVTVNDATANPHQPDLRFRGFTASPVLGLPQGLAVYQNGVRVNEPFGDTVQFDLIPDFAIGAVQVIPGSNPVFGLNALGGAIGLQLRNGLDFTGASVDFTGGSFGRTEVVGQYGHRWNDTGVYLGASKQRESGWRDESNSDVVQLIADITHRSPRVEVGATGIYANTDLNGNGPAPIDLLAADRAAVFTFPDTTRNEMGFFQTRLNGSVTDRLSVQANGYVRDLRRNTLNGDAAEFEPCEAGAAPDGTLCTESASPLVDRVTGRFVTDDLTAGDAVFNTTRTDSRSYGLSAQSTVTADWAGRRNFFLVGGAVDAADVTFDARTEIGALTAIRSVDGSGIFIGAADDIPNDEFATGLSTRNRHGAFYLTNTFSLSDRLHLTAAARYTHSTIDIVDTLGTELNGSHTFDRLNPSAGATVQIGGGITLYASCGESSRAPTAAELSCADPEEPCRVPNAFVSDPPLEQVVARTVEAGARGRASSDRTGTVEWSAAWYRSRISDDIIFVASPTLVGAGFFQNAGATLRDGLELDLRGTASRVAWFASYAWTRAAFDSTLILPGDPAVNDAATAEGELLVEPGNRLPGVPAHGLAVGLSFDIRDGWTLGLDSIVSSTRRLLGDEGNDQQPIPAYALVNLRSTYRVSDQIEAIVAVTNLFDTEYETFGALAEIETPLREAPGASVPRFVTPGAPVGAWIGLRVAF